MSTVSPTRLALASHASLTRLSSGRLSQAIPDIVTYGSVSYYVGALVMLVGVVLPLAYIVLKNKNVRGDVALSPSMRASLTLAL